MKKFIISIAMAALFAVTPAIVHADTTLNSPGSMPTVLVGNATTNPCSYGTGQGCWTTATTAKPGDIIGVQIYYKNTGNGNSEGTTISIKPRNSNGTVSSLTYTGGVASLTAPRAVGSATVNLTSPSTITYIAGSAMRYTNQSSAGQPVDESLFGSSGFNIGTLAPGAQGVVVANFRVEGDTTPTTDSCFINNFTASPSSINQGDTSTLNWYTTGCTSASISSVGSVNVNGSTTVNPSYTTTYTLTAYGSSGQAHTATTTVYVNQVNNNYCSINFTADQYTVVSGSSTVLRWNTSGITSLQIYPNLGSQSVNGSATVNVYNSTTYTLTGYGCGQSYTRTVTINTNAVSSSAPQAITTVASVLNTSSAQLNGIARANTTYGTTTAWFEWGPTTSFGYSTNRQTVNSNNDSNFYSDIVSGLSAGRTYWYRAVVQNQNGTAYGDAVRFQTRSGTTTITTPPTTVVVPQTVTNTVVAQSAPSLLELRVQSAYDRMCVNGEMDYTITYRNISSQVLQNAVLRVTNAKELTYISSSRGSYDVIDRALTVELGSIQPGEEGTVTVHARVNNTAVTGNLTVTTASVVYTNTITRAQENAIAYSLVTVSQGCPNVLGASVFGFGSFLPDTLLEWLLLILVILALIVLARQFYRKREEEK